MYYILENKKINFFKREQWFIYYKLPLDKIENQFKQKTLPPLPFPNGFENF